MIVITLAGCRADDVLVVGSRPFARERLYDEWIGFVIQHIDDLVGERVSVNANRFNGPPEEVAFLADGVDLFGSPAREERAHAALEALWSQWTRPGGPGGPPCPTCTFFRGECPQWPGPCKYEGTIDCDFEEASDGSR